MNIANALKAEGYKIEYKICQSIYESGNNEVTLPVASKNIGALILILLATRLELLDERIRQVIENTIAEEIQFAVIRKNLDESIFNEEYAEIWKDLLGLENNKRGQEEKAKILLVTTDCQDINKEIVNLLKPQTEAIFIAYRISNALRLSIYFKTKDGFEDINNIRINTKIGDVDIETLRKLQEPGTPPLPREDSVILKEIENEPELFEKSHWNRSFCGLNKNRDNIVYQYYDYLGNRTMNGFDGSKAMRNEYVLTGGSAAWCREHPYRKGLAYMLEKRFQEPVANLSGCGENLEHELGKISHYLMYKGIPKAVISFTGFNDIAGSPYAPSPTTGKMLSQVGYYSHTTENWKFWNINTFIRKMNFIANQLNSMAMQYNYKHWIFLQPDCLQDDKQKMLLRESRLNPGIEVDIEKINARDKLGREQRTKILRQVFQNTKRSNIRFIDINGIFTQE